MADLSSFADVQAFLRDRVESYEELRILLLLQTRPNESWAPSAVAAKLQMPEAVAEQNLRGLCRQGLLTPAVPLDTGAFRYQPESPELAMLVEKLVETYENHQMEVVQMMTTNAIERLRARALRTFANAFLIGKKGGKDG